MIEILVLDGGECAPSTTEEACILQAESWDRESILKLLADTGLLTEGEQAAEGANGNGITIAETLAVFRNFATIERNTGGEIYVLVNTGPAAVFEGEEDGR